MNLDQALSICRSAYRDGVFYPFTPGLGEAVRVVCEGVEAAKKKLEEHDIQVTPRKTSCRGCDYEAMSGAHWPCVDCCDNDRWCGPEPGGEGNR